MYNNDSLEHFGVKGMKWGVRRYQNKDGSLTSAGKNRYSDGGQKKMTRKERKAERRRQEDLQRRQDEWDENVRKNWTKPYNAAADLFNEKYLPKINEKWSGYDWSKTDPETNRLWEQYADEAESVFNDLYSKKFDEYFGERPEE